MNVTPPKHATGGSHRAFPPALPDYPRPEHGFEHTSTKFAGIVFGSSMLVWLLLAGRALLLSWWWASSSSSSSSSSYSSSGSYAPVPNSDDDDADDVTDETARMIKGGAGNDIDGDEDSGADKLASKTVGDAKPKPKAKAKFEAVALTFPSMRLLFSHASQLGLLLWLSWLCENWWPFAHSAKAYDRDWFVFVCFLYLVAAAYTRVGQRDHSVLNRDQTEEWKGWMQFMFLLYHYTHASEVYNAIRVFISCYVWMTGFGNFSFFYLKRDFGFVRMAQMFWRLNFLVFWLMMVHNNTYILYYICPLHTFFFFATFAALRLLPGLNHSKWGVRAKLFGFALACLVVWDVPGVFDGLFGLLLGTRPLVGAKGGALHEWRFRSALDHWDTMFGMIFALNYPMYQKFMDLLEDTDKVQRWQRWAAHALIGGTLAAATVVWARCVFLLPKTQYNESHPYFFWVPLLCYVYLRNMTRWLRSWHLALLKEAGKITLETYLMQHHVWLTTNAKTLLTVVPHMPKVNFFVVSVAYVLISYRLFRLTVSLRAMLIPASSTRAALAVLGVLGAFLAACGGLAGLLTHLEARAGLVVVTMVYVGLQAYVAIHAAVTSERLGGLGGGGGGSGGGGGAGRGRAVNGLPTALSASASASAAGPGAGRPPAWMYVLASVIATGVYVSVLVAGRNASPATLSAANEEEAAKAAAAADAAHAGSSSGGGGGGSISTLTPGVAHSLPLGLMTLAVGGGMLVCMDNFVFLSRLGAAVGRVGGLTWEAAYQPLHDRIFNNRLP
eukprot:g2362.t1